MPAIAYFDDDPLSRQVMQLLLTRKLNYTEVGVFEDSTDFLNRLQGLTFKPDIVLVDIHMQPYDGFHVLKTLRERDDFTSTKIVAVTASVMNEEVELLRKAGFDGVIGKPIDSSIFASLIDRILQGETVWRPS